MLQFTFFKALVLKMMSFDLWPDSDYLTTCIFFYTFQEKKIILHHQNWTGCSIKIVHFLENVQYFASPPGRWPAISKRLFTSLGDGMYRVFIKYCVFSPYVIYWALNNDTEGNVVYSHGKIFEKDHTIFNKHPVLDYENIQFFWNTQYISKP